MGNSHIILIKKQIPTKYCQYCHKNGHTTDNCFFNPSNSPNNNYRGEKKNINNKSRNKIKKLKEHL